MKKAPTIILLTWLFMSQNVLGQCNQAQIINLNANWQTFNIGWYQFTPQEDGEVNFCFLGMEYIVYDDCANGNPSALLTPIPTGKICGTTLCGDEFSKRLEVIKGDAIWIQVKVPSLGDPCGDFVGIRFLGKGNDCITPAPLVCGNIMVFNVSNLTNEFDFHDISGCGGGTVNTTGQDRIFELTISTPTDITIYLNSNKPDRDFLGVFQICSDCFSGCFLDGCIGYSQTTSGNENVIIPNAFGTYLIVADWSPTSQSDFNNGIDFEINAQCTPPCTNEADNNCEALQYQFNAAAPNGAIEYCFTLNFAGNPPAMTSNWVTVDGVTVVVPTANPIQNFCHTFPGPGTYVVCYEATLTDGCSFQCCRTIEVLDVGNVQNCVHGNSSVNKPTKVRWVNGDIYVAGANASSGNPLFPSGSFSRYDALGNLVWAFQLNAQSIITDFVPTDDDAFLLVGHTPIGPAPSDNSSLILKIGVNGNLISSNYLSNTGRELMTAIVRHPFPSDPANPYYIVGFENKSGINTIDNIALYNVDGTGAINWKRLFDNSTDDEYGRTLIPLNNGHVILAGNDAAFTGYFVEVDGAGNYVTARHDGSDFRAFYTGLALPNNQVVMGGDLLGTPVQAALTKMNADYTPIWTYRIAGQTRIAALDRDDNGNIYAMGYAPVLGISTPIINKIKDNGNSATLLWSRHLNDGSITNSTVIDGTLDVLGTGNIVYADGRRSAQYGFQQEDLLVVLTDTELTTCYTENTSMMLQPFVYSLDSVPNNPDSASTTLSAGPGLNVWTQMHQCVCQNCTAQFTYSASTSNCFDYSFTNTSTGYGLSYEWDFGDGGTSTAQHPTHLYAGPGTYNVCLTVSNGECSDTECLLVQINAPTFSMVCPTDYFLLTDQGVCQSDADPLAPVVDDQGNSCLQITVNCTRSDGQPLTNPFLLGITTITCVAADQYGNSQTCSYTITVIDVESPVLLCPSAPPLNTAPGLCQASFTLGQPFRLDNCTPTPDIIISATRSDNLPLFFRWPLGSTTVTYIATDASGNSTTCKVSVIVSDREAPDLTCTDYSIPIDPDACDATFSLPLPDATDNCTPPANLTFNGIRNDGLALTEPWPIGYNCVTWTVGDQAGNTATCVSCVQVWFEIDCPAVDTICAETSCEAIVPDFSDLITFCEGFRQIEAYDQHTIAIANSGTLWAWGRNTLQELGDGTSTNKDSPVQIGADQDWAKLATGSVSKHTMAIKMDGTLWAWGPNSQGQLGIGTTATPPAPMQVGTDQDWRHVALGITHSLAVKSDGTLWATGHNSNGQLGTGNQTNQTAFIQVGADQDWTMVSAGDQFSLGLKSNGTLWAWGLGANGRLGLGTTTDHSVPIQIGTDQDWKNLSAGDDYGMAIKQNGTLWAWGANASSQLGIGNQTDQLSPVQVGAGTDWADVSTGNVHTLGTKTTGDVWVWGGNTTGQLGLGDNINRTTPTATGNTTSPNKADAGGLHCIAFLNGDGWYSWGRNSSGQLGIGSTQNQLSPALLQGTAFTVTQSPPPGITVGSGCHDITLIVADTFGSRDTCFLTFCVKDTIPPEIICPEDICEFVPQGEIGATITYPSPSITDNCGATFTCVPPSGSFFPLGQTTIVCTATDGAGNTATCTFVVEVKTQQVQGQFFCGQAIITCYGALGNDVVLGLKDIRDNNTFSNPNPQNANTTVPSSMHPSWTRANLGQVFGIAIDDNSNVYVSQTTVYQTDDFGALGAGTGGDIYRLDAVTGSASAFANLPNTGQGLGNICFAAPYNSLYATNWENGFIYQIDVANPGAPTGFDIFMMDDPGQGYAPLGQLLWGIGYNPVTDRLYFGRWNENVPGGFVTTCPAGPPVGSGTNEIWSVALNANGTPILGTLTLEITMPAWSQYTDPNTQMVTFHSNPVSDIAFSSDGQRMLLAERSMCSPTSSGAHRARVMEYVFNGNNWTPVNNNFLIGNANLDQNNNITGGTNTAGGVDYGDAFYDPITEAGPAQCDQRVWATADIYGLGMPATTLRIYGIQGMPAAGNNPLPIGLNSYLIDADGMTDFAKTEVGDVEIFDCQCPALPPVACDSLQFVLNPVSLQSDSCCYSIDLINPLGPTITQVGLSISTSDVRFKNAQLAPGFSWATTPLDQYVRIENPNGFPAGTISNLITFCLGNIDDASEVPQQLTLEWYQTLANGETILACSNDFTTECPFPADTIEGCLQVLVDSVVCDPLYPSEYFFYFRVQNLGSVPVNAIALEIDQMAYPGFGFKPCAIPVPFAVPTTSVSFPTLPMGGTSVPLCIKIVTPSPVLSPVTLCISTGLFSSGTGGVCCTGQAPVCLQLLPCCDPCEQITVAVSSVEAPPFNCCYAIDLDFRCQLNYFIAIEAEIITPGVVFGSHVMGGPNTAGWHNPVSNSKIIRWAKLDNSPITGTVAGIINFCLDDIDQPGETPQQVVLRYLTQGPDGLLVACSDTLTFECPPTDYECISILSDDIVCLEDMQKYEYTFTFKNNSNPPNSANRLEISTVPGFGANYLVFPNTFVLNPPVPAGGQTTLTTCIYSLVGFPYPGNQIKLDMRLAYLSVDSTWCCFESDTISINIPPCGDTLSCCLDFNGITEITPFHINPSPFRFYGQDFIDFDGDGDLDLSTEGTVTPLVYFENIGTPGLPDFALTEKVLNNSITDHGAIYGYDYSGSKRDFFQLNTSAIGPADLYYYVPNGPSYTESNLGSIGFPNATGATFAIGDLSNDGKADMVVLFQALGGSSVVWYLEGNCTTPTPPCFGPPKQFFATPANDVDESPVPEIFDADCDGDLDLFIAFSQEVRLFENYGTVVPAGTFPDMETVNYQSNPNGITGYSAGAPNKYPTARFADVDADGYDELFAVDGYIKFTNIAYYENCDESCCKTPEWLILDNIKSTLNSTITFDCDMVSITPLYFGDCDEVTYDWGDGSSPTIVIGNKTVTHKYLQTNVAYNLCVTVVRVEPGSMVICKKVEFCKMITPACCMCGSVTDATIVPFPSAGLNPIPLICNGSAMSLPCYPEIVAYYFKGKFACMSNCGAEEINYSLLYQDGTPIKTGKQHLTVLDQFEITIDRSFFSMPGDYTLMVTRQCGTTICSCTFNLNVVSVCICKTSCSCDELSFGTSKGYSVSVGSSCLSKIFTPACLADCDEVKWMVNGVMIPGSTSGNTPFSYTFPTVGYHVVTMIVTRAEVGPPAKICTKIFVKGIYISCPPPHDALCSTGNSSLLKGSTFIGITQDGPLAPGGNVESLYWKNVESAQGDVYAFSGPGCNEDGYLVLAGGKDRRAAVEQEITTGVPNKISYEFCLKNLLPEVLPEGTALELRLYQGPQMTGESILLDSIVVPDDTTFYGWNSVSGQSTMLSNPGQFNYFVILARNSRPDDGTDQSLSYLAIDDICVEQSTVAVGELPFSSFSLYPNPTTGRIFLEFEQPLRQDYQVQLFDLMGRQLTIRELPSGQERFMLEFNPLPTGLYLLEVTNRNGRSEFRKIVVDW